MSVTYKALTGKIGEESANCGVNPIPWQSQMSLVQALVDVCADYGFGCEV